MNKIKGYIGIFLFLIVVAGIYLWEAYGREELLYSEVYVVTEDLYAGSALTMDKLQLVKIEQDRLVKGSVSKEMDIKSIIGYEAKHFIPANSQVVKDFFDTPNIVLDENEYICAIPSDWIKAFPQTLRRKDTVSIFAIPSYVDNEDMRNYSIENIKEMIKGIEPLFYTTVAHVKDSSNREVVDIKESGERMDASSKISSVELVMDPSKFEILSNLYESGYKFVIMYR